LRKVESDGHESFAGHNEMKHIDLVLMRKEAEANKRKRKPDDLRALISTSLKRL
jgi:hypothetical protein